MTPFTELPKRQLMLVNRVWLMDLRIYHVVAGGPVLVRIMLLAMGNH